MLHQIGETDDAALTEALATYYFAHDESFQGLCIFPENKAAFANWQVWRWYIIKRSGSDGKKISMDCK